MRNNEAVTSHDNKSRWQLLKRIPHAATSQRSLNFIFIFIFIFCRAERTRSPRSPLACRSQVLRLWGATGTRSWFSHRRCIQKVVLVLDRPPRREAGIRGDSWFHQREKLL
ncbi:hypothetical protein EYF80_040798 [Liparis tanakae]|uniref:Uncharacterized protein n=1 Tax=Liparis tanakae TaxID=230148 RepID=A0A4Z2G6V1_9TELE|nr:hypothetical protein EYF80_040798 [Liparis tanakae]